jgi:hypothetical protein
MQTPFLSRAVVSFTVFLVYSTIAARAQTIVGNCVITKVISVSNRLENTPGSGSAVTLANGVSLNGYEQLQAIDTMKPGEAIKLCLKEIEKGCKHKEDADKVYMIKNPKNNETAELGDSSAQCHGE